MKKNFRKKKRPSPEKEKNISEKGGCFGTSLESKTIKVAICIFIVVSTFAVYLQVQDHQFINYDDPSYVTENLNVKAGLTRESIAWAFTTSHIYEWAPINWLSYMLDYQIYGPNPKGFHLTNLFFHIANALTLFLVLLRMTGALWQSGLVAILFALHPFNVDSVAWIAERKNVLSTFFWFLTMWAYVHYIKEPNIKRYSLVFIALTLGLMSKAMLITLPFVLLLLDYWPLNRLNLENKNETAFPVQTENHTAPSHLILEKLPLLALVAGSIITSLVVLGESLESLDAYPLPERIVNALVSYLMYLQKMIWPSGLSVIYAYPVNDLPAWKGLACGLILTVITIIVIRKLRQFPYLAVGWLWYLGTLVPVIGIVQSGGQAMADRYAYVPLIGIFIMVAWGLPDLMEKWRHRDKVLIVLAGICIPTLMVVTWNQVSHWRSTITIFEHAIRVTDKEYPGFAFAHNNLGIALYEGRSTEEAISHLKIAIRLYPDYLDAHNNLGSVLLTEGKTDEAIPHFKTAIKIKPTFAQAHYNLGIALRKERNTEGAISHYTKAIELRPGFAKAHNNLGRALLDKGKTEEAISHFKTAIKIKPAFAKPHYNLGNALLAKGKKEEAIVHYREAIKIKPNYTMAHNNLIKALLKVEEIEGF